MDMMNSAAAAAAAYTSHSYYRGDALSTAAAGHAATVAANWSNLTPNVFDYYNTQHAHDYYGYTAAPDPAMHYNHITAAATANNSTGTPSPHSMENGGGVAWPHSHEHFYPQLNASNLYTSYQPPTKKRGVTNSKKERRRTISINGAFSNLRDCIPNVPKDTKLSKIKTLRLACGYIQHLMDALNSDAVQPLQEFKADLTRKTPCRAEKRKCIEAEIAAAAERKTRGRSGWPQAIWQQELKQDRVSSKPPARTDSAGVTSTCISLMNSVNSDDTGSLVNSVSSNTSPNNSLDISQPYPPHDVSADNSTNMNLGHTTTV